MFRTVLVANRGEIAVRIMRTCRELGIRTVAVFSDADRDALHVRSADAAARIGPAPARESYLSTSAVLEAARRSGADAIHPGYGFLSENPEFAEACAVAGFAFIGPSPQAMRLLADKTAARGMAGEIGVPVLPGVHEEAGNGGALLARAREIGFPLMVKAAAGGGGRGMRLVEAEQALPDALASARREALAAFGDERLLLERAVVGGRHIEVQVLGDRQGNMIHLGERDCSIQRRYQKVIEESPSPAVTPELRDRLTDAALRVARAAGYENAGTVEFLVDRDGGFSFLEMNARLQVEHGVSELVTGLDLVALQLAIAAGEPLGLRQEDVRFDGHAIECRVYAEDPTRAYAPSAGRLSVFEPPSGAGIRNDVGVEAGALLPPDYDPMLAKLLVHAPSRREAVERVRDAVAAYAIEGVRSNLGLLAAVVAGGEFADGRADLRTLEAIPPERFVPLPPDDAVSAASAAQLLPRDPAGFADPWERLGAWRLDGASCLDFRYQGHGFSVIAQRAVGRQRRWRHQLGKRELEVEAERLGAETIVLSDGRTSGRWTVRRRGPLLDLHSPEGRRYVLFEAEHEAAGTATAAVAAGAGAAALRAPMPGVVVEVRVAVGDHVDARLTLVVIEAMKMEHLIEAPEHGVVSEVHCRPGQKVAEGESLVVIEPRESADEHEPSARD